MTRLTFYGAAGTVTGSRFLLEIDGSKYLIDCGLFQGLKALRQRNWDRFPVNPQDIRRVFLTHAHIDHSGYLPKFCRNGFEGTVHSTHATRDLCEILLHDSAHLQEEDAKWANKKGFSKHSPALPLYTVQDAQNAMKFFQPIHYGFDLYLKDDLRVKLKDAGHILGSSFVEFKRIDGEKSKKILFTGDFGRPDRPILREPVQVYDVDYLVLESTYGDRLHDDDTPNEDLAAIINESYKRRGVLVIPSFSVGRTQTLLYTIRELENENKIPVMPVFIDSPMAISAVSIFKKRINDLNLTARKKSINGDDIFAPQMLKVCQTVEQSKSINNVKEKAIIISASGMVTGGRILHHMVQRLPEREHTILFIGYQAEGTRGRAILNGNETVKIHGRPVPIHAKIEKITGFSGHGDYEEILAWLQAFNKKPKKTFIVHGSPESSKAMAEKIRTNLHWQVEVAQMGGQAELDF